MNQAQDHGDDREQNGWPQATSHEFVLGVGRFMSVHSDDHEVALLVGDDVICVWGKRMIVQPGAGKNREFFGPGLPNPFGLSRSISPTGKLKHFGRGGTGQLGRVSVGEINARKTRGAPPPHAML